MFYTEPDKTSIYTYILKIQSTSQGKCSEQNNKHYGKARGSGNVGVAAARGNRLISELLDFFFLINKYGLSFLK